MHCTQLYCLLCHVSVIRLVRLVNAVRCCADGDRTEPRAAHLPCRGESSEDRTSVSVGSAAAGRYKLRGSSLADAACSAADTVGPAYKIRGRSSTFLMHWNMRHMRAGRA